MKIDSVSNTNPMGSNFKRHFESVISVSSNEILQKQFRVCKVSGIILEALSVASIKSLLHICSEPNPFLQLLGFEKWLSFFNEFISTHLNILIEKITSKHLLSVLKVNELRV